MVFDESDPKAAPVAAVQSTGPEPGADGPERVSSEDVVVTRKKTETPAPSAPDGKSQDKDQPGEQSDYRFDDWAAI